MKVEQGNQVLIVTPDGDEEEKFTQKFVNKLVTMKTDRKGKQIVYVVKDKYYLHYLHNRSYVIASTDAEFFVYEYLNKFGRDNLNVKVKKQQKNKKIDLVFKSNFLPRDEQQYFIDGMMKTLSHNRTLVMARTGYGKMQPDDTPTLTPSGFVPIGSLSVGDLVVSENGSPIKVTSTTKHKMKQQYLFTFEDGREAESGAEHLWDVMLDGGRLTLKTSEIISLLEDDIDVAIPNYTPICSKSINYDAYICGLALVNGIVGDDYIMLLNQTSNELLMNYLHKFNVEHHIDNGKIYFRGNDAKRLIKTYYNYIVDSTITRELEFSSVDTIYSFVSAIFSFNNQYGNNVGIYITGSSNHSTDVKRLLYSLGYKVTESYDGVVYTLHYELTEEPLVIKSYVSSRVCDATCIEVDSPTELYVTKDYIVTHNTYMANLVLSKISFRTLLYLKPTYISKWIKDLHEYFDLEDDDIFVIRGSKSFCELAKMKEKPKFIIISSSTFHNYMEYYTNTIKRDSRVYCIPPAKLLKVLDVHTFLTDETHKNFNNIYRAILTLDPIKVIGLTATLITKDSRLNGFFKRLFPLENRLDLLTYRTFINLENVSYYIDTGKKFNVSTMFGYNHKTFEKYILRNKLLRDSYLTMIDYYVEERYVKVKRNGDRMLIFASSLEMVKFIADHLKKKYPKFDVREFTGKDDYGNALDPDIRISHPQVLAEAIDIDSLIYTLNTVNIDSISTYIQMIGRLRYIEDFEVWFTQLYSKNIPQHYKYINGNRKYIEEVVKEYHNDIYHKPLRY
jgi:hypothetical protein